MVREFREQIPRIVTMNKTHQEIQELLDQADLASRSADACEPSERYPYRVSSLQVYFRLQTSFLTPYAVVTRWLNAQELAFLIGIPLVHEMPAIAQLVTVNGMCTEIRGKVTVCREIGPSLYGARIRFDDAIDIALYCPEATPCHVLLVEDDELVGRVLVSQLTELGAKVDHVADGRTAVERGREEGYDLIMMDLEIPVMDGLTAVRELRRQGYLAPILAMSGRADPASEACSLEAGCDKFLPKPFSSDALAEQVRCLRPEPIFSNLHNDPTVAGLLARFVQGLPHHVRAIQQTIAQDDTARLSRMLNLLGKQGSSYGFDVIAQMARDIETEIVTGKTIHETHREVRRLLMMCAHVRAPQVMHQLD